LRSTRDSPWRVAVDLRTNGRQPHRGDETVAAPAFGDQEAVIARRFAKQASQRADALIEVVLFDHGVGPHRLHEPILVVQLAGVPDEEQQQVERARRERYPRAVAGKHDALGRVDAQSAGLVARGVLGHGHDRSKDLSVFRGFQSKSRIPKDSRRRSRNP